MSAFRVLGAWGIGVAFAASAVAAWASGTMQKAPSGQMQQKPPAQMERKVDTTPIKVEAQSLTVTPGQPQAGQQVTVKFTVKNTGTGAVAKVPWSIHLATGNQTLAQGEKTNLAAGASFEVTAQWTASAGQKLLQGYVDPTGKALKNTAPVSAQIKELTLNVAQPPAATQGSAPETETRVLEHVKAKNAGASFSGTVTPLSTLECYTHNYGGATSQESPNDAVRLTHDCLYAPVGSRRDLEAYSNFRLKNGWKIVRVDVTPLMKKDGDWQWVSSAPGAGSDNPYMKFHMWVNRGGDVRIDVKVTIQGPKNTDPYQ